MTEANNNTSAPVETTAPEWFPLSAEQIAEALDNVRCFHDLSAELIAPELRHNMMAMLAAAPEPVSQWISVDERLPEPNTQVLAFYVNSHGKGRRVRAEWIARHTVEASDDAWGDGADYDEATDTYYSPAGWYECVDNWDELAYLFINEGPVTLWMPLPAAPALSAQREGGDV